MEIVTVKGFGSGLGALFIALAIREPFPAAANICILLLFGFVAYGLSIYFYTYSQRIIGAARTSTYYAFGNDPGTQTADGFGISIHIRDLTIFTNHYKLGLPRQLKDLTFAA